MADVKTSTDGPAPFSADAWDFKQIPDYDKDFISESDIVEFEKALAAPENILDDATAPQHSSVFITALNDWRPVRQKVRGHRRKEKKRRKLATSSRGTDETREGFVYTILQWPLLGFVTGWIVVLGAAYALTRLYIYFYEQYVTWRGKRQQLRRNIESVNSYKEWVEAGKAMDRYLGNEKWKTDDEYAYYDSKTVRRVREQLKSLREQAERDEQQYVDDRESKQRAVDELKTLLELCVKNNFVGIENPRLYSETYYGTKNLVQSFVDEVRACLSFLDTTTQLNNATKHAVYKHISTNFGRTALCLSGGATFAYYHLGVAKALIDANLLPSIITGTSGGALIAALLCTRTDEELKKLLVPALAGRITACHENTATWVRRWWRTGARFDSVDWAKRCSWFTRGSLTFREAYDRTGRVLNVTCVPSDPHSPTILANYLTSPDCVIWSAVIASAAVPSILNPVVLMKKTQGGKLESYSFGHKWKDGSLRTDIPLKALNMHFNVNFSIVSQVNPHINLFFFSSRGTVGRPVTHRRGRGWRGGFLGSATEQYLKLDLTKWLKVLRHLELLPRPLGQDWSEIWLQRFSGTITIWPKSVLSDFYYILSDPSMSRLARMIRTGQLSTFPKLQFVGNRMGIERLIEEGRSKTRPTMERGAFSSETDLKGMLTEVKKRNDAVAPAPFTSGQVHIPSAPQATSEENESPIKDLGRPESPSMAKRLGGWWSRSPSSAEQQHRRRDSSPSFSEHDVKRRTSIMQELKRQSSVFFDDSDAFAEEDAEMDGSAVEEVDEKAEP